MASDDAAQITTLLQRVAGGDETARQELFAALYGELKRTAQIKMSKLDGRAGHTLQPTALVHEVFLRLEKSVDFARVENRRHFFGIASRAMQQILVEHHRSRTAKKRGGDHQRVPLDDVLDMLQTVRNLDIEALDEALEKLGEVSGYHVDIVRRKFFGGQTHAEIAWDLGCSVSKVEDDWRFVRNWLHVQLRKGTGDERGDVGTDP